MERKGIRNFRSKKDVAGGGGWNFFECNLKFWFVVKLFELICEFEAIN